MSLKIIGINNGSIPEEESVALEVTSNVNLKDFILLDSTYQEPGELSNKHRHYYRFPDYHVSIGEQVKIITGVGVDRPVKVLSRPPDTKSYTLHKFYMNLGVCIWNDEGGDRIAILKVEDIDGYTIRE